MLHFIRSLLTRRRRPATRRPQPPRGRLGLENLETRLVPAGVQYHGGALLSNVEVSPVYFGPDWASSPTYQGYTGQFNDFLGRLANSRYVADLGEYGVPGKVIGRGSFTGADVTSTGWNLHTTVINGFTHASIDDNDVTAMLRGEVAASKLPAPDANRLYVVYTAPNTVETHGATNSWQNFLGYHGSFTDPSGKTYRYAMIVDPTGTQYPTLRPNGVPTTLTPFQLDTVVTSHELRVTWG
jgi:hypothetical protein